MGPKFPRDFRAALAAGNDAFKTMRYSYEPEQAKKICFMLTDLPIVLKTVILEIKPEWRHVRRSFQPVPTSKRESEPRAS